MYDINAPSKYFDLLFIFVLLSTFPIYLYRIVFAVLNVQLYLPLREEVRPMRFYDFVTLTRAVETATMDDTEAFWAFSSYLMQLMFGPKKLSLWADVGYLCAFFYSSQWGPFAYFATSWPLVFVLEFLVFPFVPQVDIPFLPFEYWFTATDPEAAFPRLAPLNVIDIKRKYRENIYV